MLTRTTRESCEFSRATTTPHTEHNKRASTNARDAKRVAMAMKDDVTILLMSELPFTASDSSEGRFDVFLLNQKLSLSFNHRPTQNSPISMYPNVQEQGVLQAAENLMKSIMARYDPSHDAFHGQ
jgi:hypothetical protein